MCDSTGALRLMGNKTYTPRNKYIALLFVYLKELVASCFLGTDKMLVDTCTKYLNKEMFALTSAIVHQVYRERPRMVSN